MLKDESKIDFWSANLRQISILSSKNRAKNQFVYLFQKTPKLGNVRRNDRLSLSIVRSPMKFTPAATKKPRRSEPASHIGREEIYVRTFLTTKFEYKFFTGEIWSR